MTIYVFDPHSEPKESGRLRCAWVIDKYDEDTTRDAMATLHVPRLELQGTSFAGAEPFEIREGEGNLLMYGGASNLWQYALGNGTTTDDQTLTYFDNNDAALGVGDSSTAAAATQTDLQAATNKLRVGMDATYPTHSPGTSSGAATMTARSTFTAANFAWNEWVFANSPDAGTGRILNRKVFSGGTKASGTWVFTVTLTLA